MPEPLDKMIQVTNALCLHSKGDTKATADLMPLIYHELRALARKHMRRERPDHTFSATELVHEAYIRLADQNRVDWNGRTHFFAIAAKTVRQILIQHAIAHRAQKRGGAFRKVTLAGIEAPNGGFSFDVLAFDEALGTLAKQNVRESQVVELRLFGGLSVKETAHVLGVSERTVKGDWAMARARLCREMDVKSRKT